MSAPEQPNLPAKGQFLVYQTEDGQVKIEVRLQGETAWLTQAHMADLFQTTVPNISMHLRNIYVEGELQPEATIQEFLTVRQEGGRQVSRSVEHYNLDAIISVGYRVKSAVATRFRIWATQQQRAHPASRRGGRGIRESHQATAAAGQAKEKGREEMTDKSLNARACLPLPVGEGWGEGTQCEQTIAGFSLSLWERVEVRVRPLPNVAEILEA